MVAAALDARCRPEVAVLHDRSTPGTRANIDHIAVAPSGVWVIDTKRYKGRIQVAKPLFGPAILKIAGRDQTGLVGALMRQVELVTPAVAGVLSDVPVRGAFCFVEGDLPLIGTPSINDILLLHRRSLAKKLNADGQLTVEQIAAITAALAGRFPPA
jgi:hypothetical protein